ncbi:hypothetical protein JTB14_023450 [Gonioctena quinquepunctata]|nr:hypothetical protein JTB14_023450 [Gonioctena quinquepunctata]
MNFNPGESPEVEVKRVKLEDSPDILPPTLLPLVEENNCPDILCCETVFTRPPTLLPLVEENNCPNILFGIVSNRSVTGATNCLQKNSKFNHTYEIGWHFSEPCAQFSQTSHRPKFLCFQEIPCICRFTYQAIGRHPSLRLERKCARLEAHLQPSVFRHMIIGPVRLPELSAF